jgi:preprotein translocase subunit SecD
MGMAVDANVLIFSRIREEIAAGMTVQRAINEGFGRAFTAILDANLTTCWSAASCSPWAPARSKASR